MGYFVFGMILVIVAVIIFLLKMVMNIRNRSLRKQLDSAEPYDKPSIERYIDRNESSSSIMRIAMLVFAGIGVLLVLISSVRVVDANTVGIPTTNGNIGDPLSNGIHFVAPWSEITEYPTRIQELSMLRAPDEGDKAKDDSVEVIASGGGSMSVDSTIRFSVAPDKVAGLFKQAGTVERVKDTFVRPEAREVIRNVFGLYSAEDGYSSKRGEISLKIQEELTKRLAKNGIVVESVNIRDVLPEKQVLDSINAILKARNDAAKALEDQKKQITEAETRKEVATRDAEAKITAANADASAVKIAAEAQAEANAKIAASLTPELVDLEKTKACADAIAKSGATVINICGNAQATSSGSANGSSVIVDGRSTTPAGG